MIRVPTAPRHRRCRRPAARARRATDGQRERHQYAQWGRAHCRQIAQCGRRGAVADLARREPGATKVHALERDVGAGDERLTRRHDDRRRVVAESHCQRAPPLLHRSGMKSNSAPGPSAVSSLTARRRRHRGGCGSSPELVAIQAKRASSAMSYTSPAPGRSRGGSSGRTRRVARTITIAPFAPPTQSARSSSATDVAPPIVA